METKQDLYNKREILSIQLRKLKGESDKKLDNKIYRRISEIKKLIEEISEIRSKLHELGVPAEDC